MSSTKKQALLVAAVLGLAALAGETRYQYHQERAVIEKSTAFYNCCGLSRLELIKTKAVIRILRENPNPDGTAEEAGRLVRAWSMAVNMTKVDVLRPQANQVFHEYGIRAKRLLRISQLSPEDLAKLEHVVTQRQLKKSEVQFTDAQKLQLMQLHAGSPSLVALSIQALSVFEKVAVSQGYKHDRASLFNGVTYYGPTLLGRLAICAVEPELLRGGSKKDASFVSCVPSI